MTLSSELLGEYIHSVKASQLRAARVDPEASQSGWALRGTQTCCWVRKWTSGQRVWLVCGSASRPHVLTLKLEKNGLVWWSSCSSVSNKLYHILTPDPSVLQSDPFVSFSCRCWPSAAQRPSCLNWHFTGSHVSWKSPVHLSIAVSVPGRNFF